MNNPLQKALDFYNTGRLGDAESWCRRSLTGGGGDFDALHLLGVIAHQTARPALAIDCLERALHLNGSHPFAWNNLGEALRAQGRLREAAQCYGRAMALAPNFPDAHNNLGLVHLRQEEFDSALACFERAVQLAPAHLQARFNMAGVLKARGDLSAAAEQLRIILTSAGPVPEVLVDLGGILHAQGELSEEESCYRRAIELDPRSFLAHKNLGAALLDAGRLEEAEVAYETAVALDPVSAQARYALASVYRAQGRMDAARDSLTEALRLAPDLAEARWIGALASLPLVLGIDETCGPYRQRFATDLAELARWAEAHPDLAWLAVGTTQPFHLAYHEETNRDLLRAHGDLCVSLMAHWRQRSRDIPEAGKVAAGPLRIGIVSAHVRNHSVWTAIVKGWLTEFHRSGFDIYIFHTGVAHDGETEWARAHCTAYHQSGMDIRGWAGAIAEAGLDVLIYPEIGMDMLTLKLASLRLAPIQVAAWGHPETTGLSTIDYYLSAQAFEPPEGQAYYTEQLVALPALGCAYTPLAVKATIPNLDALGVPSGVPILISPGMPSKYLPEHDRVFVDIARQLGPCRIVFFTHRHRALSDALQRRLQEVFRRESLRFEDYCVFVPWLDRPSFYGLLQQADVFLDTIGFSGFNTVMQGLECSLPVVTREGRFMRGRFGSGVLRQMGLDELVADSDASYVALAVRIAGDATYRASLRQRLEAAVGKLYEDRSAVVGLVEFLRSVGRRASSEADRG